jgi:hypothetical protein
MENVIANTPEYKQYFNQYQTNLLKFQPGVNWYFRNIEKGHGFQGAITLEEMKEMAARVSPVGQPLDPSQVTDITPSYEQLCESFPTKWGYDYNQYSQWISKQTDVFYYSREKHNFSVAEGYAIAAALGYHKVILENLS